MNTQFTFNLNTEIQYLKGVGPRRGKVLNQFGIKNINDLIRHFPRKYLDRTNVKKINQIKIGEQAVIIGKVSSFGIKRMRRGKFFELTLLDESGHIKAIWFNGISWIVEKFSTNDVVAIFGKIEFYKGYRIIHPEFDILNKEDERLNTGRIIPLYSSNSILKKSGLDSRGFSRLIYNVFENIENINDHFENSFLNQESLMNILEAFKQVHFPKNKDTLQSALYRLKFEEYFFQQLVLAIHKYKIKSINAKKFDKLGEYAKKMYRNLEFQLTNAQIKVMREIRKDLSSNKPMNRLIQGDVGCGKTVVAMLTSAIIVGDNCQVAIMAPTEILAEQHYNSFVEYCDKLNISCELLVSNIKNKDKELIYNSIEKGKIQIIVGTHALIQESVKFKNLELVIIDEQHRFGVDQRKILINKGRNVNILAMTATPIPRTLTLALHGDMDISFIDEQPKNRIPIKTKIILPDDLDNIYNSIRKEMDNGRFCFIVYPIIKESEKLDLKDAETGYQKFKNEVFSNYKVGYLHGKLKKEEKSDLMKLVNNGEIQCLISTTVVEVGINNPNATIMLIENSERFGLTQLHQLRGRVGRGQFQSYCYLIKRKHGKVSDSRLHVLESTLNGFDIADEDLKLRGPGDFFGTQQHGYITNPLCNFTEDGPIIRHARNLAFTLIDIDADLNKNYNIKNKLIKDYKHMLEFVNIG